MSTPTSPASPRRVMVRETVALPFESYQGGRTYAVPDDMPAATADVLVKAGHAEAVTNNPPTPKPPKGKGE